MNTGTSRTRTIAFIVVAAVLALVVLKMQSFAPAAKQPLPLFYSNSTAGFSMRFPEGYAVDQTYRYQAFGPGKDINGIKFTIATTTTAGTNLGTDTYVSVEEIPQVQNCSAKLFLENAVPNLLVDGDVTYSVASSTGAAAGNRYTEIVYAVPGTNPCVAVRYFIHYGVFENYPAGTVKQFDEQALLTQFDAIRHSLNIVQ